MTRRYRIAFLMQQVLGHATYSAGLERAVAADPEIDAAWTPISYWREHGLIERVPGVPAGVKGVARAAEGVHRALARGGFDAILFNTPALATSATPWMRRTPAVIALDVTARQFDREGEHFGHRAGDGRVAAWKHRWNRRVFDHAAALAPWSTWARESLEKDYGVPREKIRVIPPGVDIEEWTPRPAPREALPRLLFVGGDFRRKGGDLLLEWFFARGRGRCVLNIVSADPATRGADAVDVHVHRNLRPNDARLRELYWSSDLFVLPSRSEPFGIACVEALAAGLPVVATEVGGIPDIVDDGATGRLVKADDVYALGQAIDSMLDSALVRRAMSENARVAARERFDAARNYGRLISLLKASAQRRVETHEPAGHQVAAR